MKIIILGNGGHSKVIQEMIACMKDQQIIAILDDKYQFMNVDQGIMYAPISYVEEIITPDVKVVMAIGNNTTRKSLAKKLKVRADQYLTVVHPTAVISPTATIGNGTVVMPHALINAEAIIGNHCIINTGAIVEHENLIGDYSHISPNATLTGNVSVGVGVHIGASATIIPGIHIGNWSIIGAGSTVIEHIPAHRKAVGCPTRLINNDKGKEKSVDKVVMLYDKG